MFWNGTYVVFREIEQLLEKEPISLSQLIDADDILQECKTQNKKLVEFLVRPDTLAELISLITEEPSKNIELSRRYRRASMACEILTSEIPGISQLLSNDQTLMNKLCDFIAQPVPLNPLLASFFSKTIEMLLARRAEQDYYSYQIVCLRVLEFFKQREDFLPNLLKHIGTSAIMDTFKHLIWIEGLEIQPGAMEWLDSYRLIEQLVQIICGTHSIEDVPLRVNSENVKLSNGIPEEHDVQKDSDDDDIDEVIDICGDSTVKKDEIENEDEKSDSEKMDESDSEEKLEENKDEMLKESPFDQSLEYEIRVTRERLLAGQSANAAHLLAEIVHMSMEVEYITAQIQKSVSNPLWDKSISQETIELLLQSMFTAPEDTREDAIVNGVQVLLAILQDKEFGEIEDVRLRESLNAHKCALYKSALKGAIALHLPLLHQVLLHGPPKHKLQLQYGAGGERVGRARLAVVSLLERAVCVSMCHPPLAQVLHALGTLPLLVHMFLKYKWNNFLHTHVKNVFVHMTEYSLFLDYADPDVISKLIDAWEEENDMKNTRMCRSGYMGHLAHMLAALSRAPLLAALPPALQTRYHAFYTHHLAYVLHLHSTPLGGQHPADRPETVAEYDENSTYGYSTYNARWSRYEEREDNDFSKNEESFNTYSKDYYEDRLAEDEEDFRQVKQLFEDRRRQQSEEPESENESKPSEIKTAWDDEDEEEIEARKEREGEVERELEEAGQTISPFPSAAPPVPAQASPWDSVGVTPSTSAEDGWANFNAFTDNNLPQGAEQGDAWASAGQPASFTDDAERQGWADFDAPLPTVVTPPEQAPLPTPSTDTETLPVTVAPSTAVTPLDAASHPVTVAPPDTVTPPAAVPPSDTETEPLESFPTQMATAIELIELEQSQDEKSSRPDVAEDEPRHIEDNSTQVCQPADADTELTGDERTPTTDNTKLTTDDSRETLQSDIKENEVTTHSKEKPTSDTDTDDKMSADPVQLEERR